MAKFAAHDDISIYAVGNTPEDSIQNARDAANEPTAEFEASPISDALAAQIERDGWNGHRQSFAYRNGQLVDTTDE